MKRVSLANLMNADKDAWRKLKNNTTVLTYIDDFWRDSTVFFVHAPRSISQFQ